MTTFIPTFPTFPTLANAIAKTRRLTGASNAFQRTDAQIVQQMHSFYSYDLPAKFRSLKLKDIYTFTTNQGQDVYPFNSELYITVDNPCYCAKREIKLFTDPWNFYGVNYNWQQMDQFTTGTGITGPYTGFTIASPLIASVNNDPGSLGSSNGQITAITQATYAQVTSANHGLLVNQIVVITNVSGMIELNGNQYTVVAVIDANNFTIGVDSTILTPYTTGGIWSSIPLSRGSNLFFPQGRVQNILITANVIGSNGIGNTQNVTDDGQGNLIQIFQTSNNSNQEYGWNYYRQYASLTPNTPGNATINYQTGEIIGLTFAQAIPQGTPIQIQYNPNKLSIPLSIMFYQNQFTLAPVPDAGYTIELTCYRQPIQALLAADLTGNPELSEWWEILAVGAAKKIFEDRLDSDGVIYIDKMLKERYDIIETRTYAQIGQQRIYTIYTDQLTHNYSQSGGWGAPGGSI